MKGREAEDRIAAALTTFALTHLEHAAAMSDEMRRAGEAGGLRGMKQALKAMHRHVLSPVTDDGDVAATLVEVLTARGLRRGHARREADSVVGLVRALVVEFPDAEQLGRAARLAAADVTGRMHRLPKEEHPKRARRALDAWRAYDAARTAAFPPPEETERLLGRGPLAMERLLRRRQHELGVDDLRATFVRTWSRVLEN